MERERPDLASQSDRPVADFYNSGFVAVKPTPLSFDVFTLSRDIASKKTGCNDQEALNMAIRELQRQKSGLNAALLDERLFMSGYKYFEQANHLLPRADDPCSSNNRINCTVLVVHHNWLSSMEAKIYRFREHLMWLYDGENGYYTSRTRKYLTYSNSKPSASMHVAKRQVSTLRTALSIAYLLKRVVILPRFYCNADRFDCPLSSLIQMKLFDAYFSNRYRESSFLQHPRVPRVVKRGVSYRPITSMPYNPNTMTIDNLVIQLQNSDDKVINIGELDGIRTSNHSFGTAFDERIRKAFRLCSYNQLEPGELL